MSSDGSCDQGAKLCTVCTDAPKASVASRAPLPELLGFIRKPKVQFKGGPEALLGNVTQGFITTG